MDSKVIKFGLILRNHFLKRLFLLSVLLFGFSNQLVAQNTIQYLEKAIKLEKKGQYQQAKKEIDTYFQLVKGDVEAHLTRYRIYFKIGLSQQETILNLESILTQALYSFKKVKKTSHKNKALADFFAQEEANFIKKSLNKGSEAFNLGNFKTALIWFNLILDYLPNHKTSRELRLFSL